METKHRLQLKNWNWGKWLSNLRKLAEIIGHTVTSIRSGNHS